MFRRLLYVINWCAIAVLFLACLSCYILPAVAWPLSFLGLGFPFIVIAIFAFLLLWALWRKKMFWLNLLVLMLSTPFIKTVYALNFSAAPEKGIKLMSYNVRNFDLYNWSGNTKTRRRMMDLIKKESPDIICFQEFYTDD